MRKWTIEIGATYSQLTVLSLEPREEKQPPRVLCLCSCGTEKIINGYDLKKGKIQSCGCARKKKKAPVPKKPRKKTYKIKDSRMIDCKRFYDIWYSMKKRCVNLNSNVYQFYGAKGITYIPEWEDFANFKADMLESYNEFEAINGKDTATIDRINSELNYTKENCRWMTIQQQQRNKSSNISVIIRGKTYGTLTELAEDFSELEYQTISRRYYRGKRGEELIAPAQRKEPRKGKKKQADGTYK